MIKIPPIEHVDVKALKKDGDNPNVMTRKQKEALAFNIKKYGFLVPIITNRDLVVADGEQRLDVAVEILKMEKVPVIRLPIQEVDRRIIRQVMNKLKGTHDEDRDLLEFQRIIKSGRVEDLKALLALTDAHISQIQDALGKLKDEPAPPVPEIPTTKFGEVYILGAHRVMCGDATNAKDIDTLMKGGGGHGEG